MATAYFSFSQNLVFNGSFEIRDSIIDYNNVWSDCPFASDSKDLHQLPKAKGWSNPLGYYNAWHNGHNYKPYSTSDYFHTCSSDALNIPWWYVSSSNIGVPYSKWITGYQEARTGNGFATSVHYIYLYNYSDLIIGEFIQSKLKKKLSKDCTYRITFYLNKGNLCSYSINKQGAFFSSTKIKYNYLMNGINSGIISPQVKSIKGYINDTLNWVKIDGVYIANGDELYITIGNFDFRQGMFKFEYTAGHQSASYAIDDISLYPILAPLDSANCGNDTAICLGNSFSLGITNVKPEFRAEYSFEWYVLGKEDSIISTEEHPIVYPKTSTTYIVKVLDFKFDKSTDTITVNVVDCAEPTSLLVYPNPTNDIVNFKFNSPIPEQLKIELYDVIGRKIRSTNFQQNHEIKEVQMNLFDLASGMYFYNVVIGSERKFVGKIVKVE